MIWNKTLAAGVTLTPIHTAAGAERTEQCAAITEKAVATLFDRWNQSLQTGNPDKVAANYVADTLLLPTVSNMPRDTPAEIRDYCVHFLRKRPFGRIDERTIKVVCNQALDAGLYTFRLTGPDGKTTGVHARYTFNCVLQAGKWLISQHHSSMMPEPAVASRH